MKQAEYKMIVLTASDGMVLTDGEAYSSVGGEVFLGANDAPGNWREISEAEYEQLTAEVQEK